MTLLLIIIFLLQNFLQVFVMGIFIVPDIFLLSVMLCALCRSGGRDRQVLLIWTAFAGGLLWDLRWTNLPGLTAAFNSAVVAAAICYWYKAPAQGRTTLLFSVYALATQILSGLVHYFIWNLSTQAALRQFIVQQLLSVPVLVILCFIFWRVSESNA